MGGVVVFVLVVVLIAAGLWLGWYLKKKRREAFARVAASLGFQYAADDPFGLVDLPFQLFGKGDGRGTENVLWGRWQDLEVKCLDYWYYDESTDSNGRRSRSYHRFSCSITELELDGQPLAITPENLFTRLADHLGFHDVTYESEEFNRRFRVTCKDPKFATDMVDARMMQWLLTTKGWSFEMAGTLLLCYRGRVDPNGIVPVMGTLKEFRDHIPRVAHDLYAPKTHPSGERTSP